MFQFSKLSGILAQKPKSAAWILLCAASILYAVYWAGQIIYRLTLHPLARFPGPFLCRVGYLQQLYYEAVLNGRFLEKLPEYHRKYGPVVRINPHEVHINDPSVFHEIYKQNTAYTKDPIMYSLGMSTAITMTIPVHDHKLKRQTLDPCFSKRRVNMMENGLYEELERVFDKIRGYGERGEDVPIQELYYCYTVGDRNLNISNTGVNIAQGDIISRHLFGKSLDLISAPDFMERAEEMRSFTRGIWVAVHFQFIRATITAMPLWVASMFSDAWPKVIQFCEVLAKEAIAQFDQGNAVEKKPGKEETIFECLLTDHARRREKGQKARSLTLQELSDESTAILNAGTEPTATMMAYATYFFLRYPKVQSKILDDLETVKLDQSGRLPLQKIEALPYFAGFVRETLRHVPLVPGRLPRTVPKGGLYVPAIDDTIPEGYVVGISHLLIHENPNIFARPQEFDPERWMGESGKKLNHWLLSFSKGRTDCIGKTLAYAEMHLVLANLFTRFQLELTPGSHEGMEWMDRVTIHPKQNLRIKIKAIKPNKTS